MSLYSEIILKHARDPLFARSLERYSHQLRRSNPVCGDRVQWDLYTDHVQVHELGHQTRGCALCIASASILAQMVNKKAIPDVLKLLACFQSELHNFLEHGQAPAMPEVEIFDGLLKAPARLECVLLPWTTFEQLLTQIDMR